MPTTGPKFPTAGATADRAGATAWTNPGNITANDGSDASVVVPTDYLISSGYGFTLPDCAKIRGVTLKVEASESGTGTSFFVPQLHSATTPTLIGNVDATVVVSGATKVVSTSGSGTSVWGATLTPAVVNDAGFGATIWSTDSTNGLGVDYETIEVEYTTPLALCGVG